MGDQEKMSIEAKFIHYFSNIKNHCDSGIDFISKVEKGEAKKGDFDVFHLTEKIQEEIEEIRDLLFQ